MPRSHLAPLRAVLVDRRDRPRRLRERRHAGADAGASCHRRHRHRRPRRRRPPHRPPSSRPPASPPFPCRASASRSASAQATRRTSSRSSRRHRPASSSRAGPATICAPPSRRTRSQIAYCADVERRLRDLDDAGGRHEADAGDPPRRPRALPGLLAATGRRSRSAGPRATIRHTEIYVVDAATGGGLVALTSCAGGKARLLQRLPGVVARRQADRVHPPGRLRRRRRPGSTSRSGS